MVKIVMIVPFEDMEELALEVWNEQKRFSKQESLNTETYDFTVIHAPTTDLVLSMNLDADVVIARGATAFDLMRSHYPIPVVELVIAGDDILTMLYQLKQQYNTSPAAILGSNNMILGVEDTAKRVGVNLTPYYLQHNTDDEIYRNVRQAFDDGKRVIIGGMRGCIYAHSLGMPHLLITSGRNSIWNAISAAKQLGVASRKTQEHHLSMDAMVDNAFEGLVALDKNGNITALNRSAYKILGLTPGDWCLGMHIREVLRSPQIARLVMQSSPIVDEIIEYHNTHISFKKVTIYLRDETIGYILTFLNAVQIQETEGKLRGKLYPKGHRAKYSFVDIIGESAALQEVIQTADAYACTNSNVLICGESGTGKELFSQSIHNASPRRQQPFVAINCAAIPENLLESELFGYVGGAFTGANKEGKAGLFEIAHQGTIFLDEISEMPLALQGRLLRVLQEREIMRLGHDQIIPIDVRIITATNKDLFQQVRNGLFREDLYYRIDVLRLSVPSLREREHDVSLLASAFLREFCVQQGIPPLALTPEAEMLLCAQPWPGNIRQLRNVCERLSVLCPPGKPITAEQLTRFLPSHTPITAPPATVQPIETTHDLDAILEVLQAHNGNKTLAAQALGISRVTLWRQLKKLEVSSSS